MKLLLLAKRVRGSNQLFGSMLVVLALITVAFALWMGNAPTLNAEDKCTICHLPPGNPENAQTLTIGCSAVDAHMRNHPGDCMGPCPCQVTQSQNP